MEPRLNLMITVNVRSKEGSTGQMVGFFREFPFISGQAKNFEELVHKLSYDLGLYFKTFGEGQEKLKRYGIVVGTGLNFYGEKPARLEIPRPELGVGEGWIEKLVTVK